MIEVDRLMEEEYQIELIQMMENAGRCLAILARLRFLDLNSGRNKVAIIAGPGGNGGGALVCARRLNSWDAEVDVFLVSPDRMTSVPQHQLETLTKMEVNIGSVDDLSGRDDYTLIIDGIVGYSLQGDPRGAFKQAIHWINDQETPVLALDTPSGIDIANGRVHDPAVRADATLTLALPKRGLYDEKAEEYRGELYLGDISVPPELYEFPGLGLKVSKEIFKDGDIIRLD